MQSPSLSIWELLIYLQRRWHNENSSTRCGPPHTARAPGASLLGKVLYWINQPLLSLNQYCETIKGVRGRQAHTKACCGGRRARGQLSPWKRRVWFRSKENSWCGNNRTFRKNTAVPPSLPAARSPSVSLTACLSLCGLFYITASLCLSVHMLNGCIHSAVDWQEFMKMFFLKGWKRPRRKVWSCIHNITVREMSCSRWKVRFIDLLLLVVCCLEFNLEIVLLYVKFCILTSVGLLGTTAEMSPYSY